MNNKLTPITRLLFVSFLFVLFLGALLIKPIHLLFHNHHKLHAEVCLHLNNDDIFTERHETCPICEFEFCLFIPHKNTPLPQLISVFYEREIILSVSICFNQQPYSFQLRAPPIA